MRSLGNYEWMNQPIKKVAIIGGASSRKEAPVSDQSWEIWSAGSKRKHLPRISRWFEIHSIPQIKRAKKKTGYKKYIKFLRRLRRPVYMQQPHPDIPKSVAYPLSSVLLDCGRCFTSTVSYMIGLAIHEGYEGIGIWGVHMIKKKEYLHQWAGVQYLLALAIKLGIKVYLHPACPIEIPDRPTLTYTKVLYGYDWDHPDAWWNNLTKEENKAVLDLNTFKKR